MNSNKKIQFGQTERIEGMIAGLTRKLEQLAPHPETKFHLAPLFSYTSRGNVISAAFNSKNMYQMALEAYNRDLPLRISLERRLVSCRQLLAGSLHTASYDFPTLAMA